MVSNQRHRCVYLESGEAAVIPDPHPASGMRFVVVIPGGDSYTDVRETYCRLAQSRPWLRIITEEQLEQLRHTDSWLSPDLFVLSWEAVVVGPKSARRAHVAVIYNEAIGEPKNMIPWHVEWFERFEALAPTYDCVLAHTPKMADWLSDRLGLVTDVFPLGWDPAMGEPNFDCDKKQNVAFYGYIAGNREWAIPALKYLLGSDFVHLVGHYGLALNLELNQSQTVLHVPHSDVMTFPSFRLWKAASSSAALLSEATDTWPFVAGEHFIAIPKITIENLCVVRDAICEAILDNEKALSVARRAHELGLGWATEKLVDEKLVAIAQKLREVSSS